MNVGFGLLLVAGGGFALERALRGRGSSLASDEFSPPVADPYVSSGWGDSRGYRASASNPNPKHEGLDFRAATGTPIFAMADGLVVLAELVPNTYAGRYVRLQHAGGRVSESLHFSRVDVRKGARVRRGQLLGLAGTSGINGDGSVIPHLHLTVRLSAAALARYVKLYGTPIGGFGSTNRGGTAVPAEPLVPARYAASVISRDEQRGVAPAWQLAA